MSYIPKPLRRLTSFLYDLVISRFLTITAHVLMLPHMTHPTSSASASLLDVGTGTGAPLLAIVNEIKRHYNKIVGVDLNHEYTL